MRLANVHCFSDEGGTEEVLGGAGAMAVLLGLLKMRAIVPSNCMSFYLNVDF